MLMIFASMSFVWCLTALPIMISAFLVGEPCPDPKLNCSVDEGSLIENFNLVGAKSHLAEVSTMAFVFGNIFGAPSISRFSDLKGRRPALLISLIGVGAFGIIAAFSPNIYAFIVLRFVQGIFLPGCGITNWVLNYESTSMCLRTYSALVFGLTWVIGYSILSPVAYFIRSWRYLMLATSAPSLIFGILYSFFIPESFHFLVSQGRVNQLKSWIQRANRFSKQPRDLAIAEKLVHLHSAAGAKNLEDEDKVSHHEFFHELFKRKKLVAYTAIVAYVWTCDSFIYYGLRQVFKNEDVLMIAFQTENTTKNISTLNSSTLINFNEDNKKYLNFKQFNFNEDNKNYLNFLKQELVYSLISTSLAGNKYLNFTLSGLVEIPSYLVTPYCLEKLGRRFFQLLVATPCIYVYASEIFPTVLRSGCIGICVLLERIGGVLAPTVRSMSLLEAHLPNIFFAVSSGLAAALTLMLPETRGKELPDFATEVADVDEESEKDTES
ncbi:putative transporter [Aphelenchoides bicaudatus]|nr:putative transporter [Aphelenchoides bicaudatus]